MSLRKGKFNLSIYKITSELPEYVSILNEARKLAAPPLGNTGCDTQVGFASGAVLLDTDINAGNSIFDGWLVLNLRKAQLKVNGGLLKATIQRDEQAFMTANDIEFVPNGARRKIKEEAEQRLTPHHAKLAVKGTEFALKGDTLYIASQSIRDCDEVIMYLAKLGIQAERECAFNKMIRIDRDKAEWKGGRAFLTWFFKENQIEGNEKCWGMEGPLDFIADSEFCTQAALRGKGVTISNEAISFTVQENKYIRKAKLILAITPGECWKCGFDADHWSFGSMELPESECFGDRMETINEFLIALDGRFGEFVKTYNPSNHAGE